MRDTKPWIYIGLISYSTALLLQLIARDTITTLLKVCAVFIGIALTSLSSSIFHLMPISESRYLPFAGIFSRIGQFFGIVGFFAISVATLLALWHICGGWSLISLPPLILSIIYVSFIIITSQPPKI